MLWVALLISCGGEPSAPEVEAPPPEVLPTVQLRVPTREVKSPAAVPLSYAVRDAQKVLKKVVSKHGRDPENPWAAGHALIAFGPKMQLSNKEPAVEYLFEHYAELVEIGGETGIRFPQSKGESLVEPHSDLLLKAFTEVGVDPKRTVTVQGQAFEVGDLYRTSAHRAWVDGDQTGFGEWNDTPWALQALTTWGPEELSWTATGGHAMTLDGYTHAVTARLVDESVFMQRTMRRGRPLEKKGQKLFSYTCGGAHLMQGAVYAVGRGYGSPEDRAAVASEIPVWFWRLDQELMMVDKGMAAQPDFAPLLAVQRLKFLGHLLETLHKAAAMEVFVPDNAQKAQLIEILRQLVGTINMVSRMGLFDKMDDLKANESTRQMYLDLIGDSAHAIRAIDLATGTGVVRF